MGGWGSWSRVTAPGLLGSADLFRERFAVPIERDGDTGRRALLSRIIRPFILRRLKSQVARELPPRTEVRLDIELGHAERLLYDEMRVTSLLGLAGGGDQPNQQRIRILAALTRLRQLACDPRLVDSDLPGPSAKLDALRELLREMAEEGHRALVFSQFVSLLTLIKPILAEEGLTFRTLDGSMPAAQRTVEVDAFQAGQADVCYRAGYLRRNRTG